MTNTPADPPAPHCPAPPPWLLEELAEKYLRPKLAELGVPHPEQYTLAFYTQPLGSRWHHTEHPGPLITNDRITPGVQVEYEPTSAAVIPTTEFRPIKTGAELADLWGRLRGQAAARPRSWDAILGAVPGTEIDERTLNPDGDPTAPAGPIVFVPGAAMGPQLEQELADWKPRTGQVAFTPRPTPPPPTPHDGQARAAVNELTHALAAQSVNRVHGVTMTNPQERKWLRPHTTGPGVLFFDPTSTPVRGRWLLLELDTEPGGESCWAVSYVTATEDGDVQVDYRAHPELAARGMHTPVAELVPLVFDAIEQWRAARPDDPDDAPRGDRR